MTPPIQTQNLTLSSSLAGALKKKWKETAEGMLKLLTWCVLLKLSISPPPQPQKRKLPESFLESDWTRVSFSQKSKKSHPEEPKIVPKKWRMRWKPWFWCSSTHFTYKKVWFFFSPFPGSTGRFLSFFLTDWMSRTTWDRTFHEVSLFFFFSWISVPL